MVTLHKLYIKAFPRLLGFFLGFVPKPKSQHEFPKLLLFLLFVFINNDAQVFCQFLLRSKGTLNYHFFFSIILRAVGSVIRLILCLFSRVVPLFMLFLCIVVSFCFPRLVFSVRLTILWIVGWFDESVRIYDKRRQSWIEGLSESWSEILMRMNDDWQRGRSWFLKDGRRRTP